MSHRSEGTSAIVFTPSCNNCQKASGLSAPPGNLQPTPTIAIGSLLEYSMKSSWACMFSKAQTARLIGDIGFTGSELILIILVLHALQFANQQGFSLAI